VLERRDVLDFFEHHPHAWLGLVQVLCRRLRATTEQTAEVALLDLPGRLAKTLLRLAGVDQDGPPPGPALPIGLSQRELGNIVGATRESVNKCLREWQRNGVIKTETISSRSRNERRSKSWRSLTEQYVESNVAGSARFTLVPIERTLVLLRFV